LIAVLFWAGLFWVGLFMPACLGYARLRVTSRAPKLRIREVRAIR